jgi:hypothetical protein
MIGSFFVRRDRLRAALGAGLVSGATLAAFAWFAQWRTGAPPAATYEFLAGVVSGTSSAGASWAVPAGIVVLFAGSIGWAFGYVHAARRQPQLLTRPWISGIVFGLVVWVLMQVMLVAVNRFTPPTTTSFDRDITAFTLFFGVPLALTAARLTRAST